MNNMWVQIIGTLLIGGGLLNWIFTLYMAIFGMIEKPDNINSVCIILGGKIQRKWFLINNVIFFIALLILTLLMAVFKNWVMLLILIPYFIALFILYWGNVYKRINDISSNHRTSLLLTIILALFCLCSSFIYKILLHYENIIMLLISLIWILLFVLPSKNNNDNNQL